MVIYGVPSSLALCHYNGYHGYQWLSVVIYGYRCVPSSLTLCHCNGYLGYQWLLVVIYGY